jgi:allantoin racemase
MKREKILVINPAANPEMTGRIDDTLAPFRLRPDVEVICCTAPGGPRMVATSSDVDVAAVALRAFVSQESADVIVIACYADPGLRACREATRAPVFGIGRCAALTALARADNFGVIAMSDAAIPRHWRALREAGLERHLVGERALAGGKAIDQDMFERMMTVGRALRDEDGAAAIVIGCAEFGALRGRLELALGVPIIDPVEAAMGMAMTVVGRVGV